VDENETTLLSRIDSGIAHFTINRPAKRNAVTLAMWKRMGEIFQSWADMPEIRVIVLRGAGDKSFCAGADISEFANLRATPEQGAVYNAIVSKTYTIMRDIPKPTIARIEGSCMGGGLEIAQLCDIQIAAETATFAIPPAKLGAAYKLEDTLLLVENVGAKVAKEMLLTARSFSAVDALRWGLVNRVVPAEELDATVDRFTADITTNAPLSVKASKILVNQAQKENSDRDYNLCNTLIDACTNSEDIVEGRQAFAEKRPPKFTGR